MTSALTLSTLNAILNGIAALLIVVGLIMIRQGNRERHRQFMLAAAVTSGVFLISYVAKTMQHGTTLYGGEGALRLLYLLTLGTHLLLAMVLPILAGLTLYYGLRGQYKRHRRIARFAVPVWLYVSVTGVLVFVLLRPYY